MGSTTRRRESCEMKKKKMKTDLFLLENMGIHDMEGHTIAPNWTPFDALVEVSIVAIKKLHKFHRLFQEKSLKKPISVEETPTVVTLPVRNKQSRFGDQDVDDQECCFELDCFELETKNNMPNLVKQEKAFMTTTTAVPVSKRVRLGDQDEWCLETKKKKQSWKSRLPIKTAILLGPNPPPDLPPKFQDTIKAMGGCDKLLVIQKKLFKTDITKGNSRFSIPLRQIVRTDFLTEEEKEELRAQQEIRVRLINPKSSQDQAIKAPETT